MRLCAAGGGGERLEARSTSRGADADIVDPQNNIEDSPVHAYLLSSRIYCFHSEHLDIYHRSFQPDD